MSTLQDQLRSYTDRCNDREPPAGMILFDTAKGYFYHVEATSMTLENLSPMVEVAKQFVKDRE